MLSVRNLSKTYDNGVCALRDVSLEVPTGMFGLLGPNGAGKSTLMRTVATLQEPDGGAITFDGLDVLREKGAVRRLLGYLPQELGVYPRVSAERMLDHLAVLKGLSRRRDRREAVAGLLRMTNLWDVRKRKLGTFSGGMKQRFGIAQALLGDPRLIIVDEPTAGLDPVERQRFLNLLSEIGQKVVVILSTHIVEDVSDLCRSMAILAAGRVRLTGDPRSLIRELEGQVWRRSIDKAELGRYEAEMAVISSRWDAGRLLLHVLSPTSPGTDFEPAHPTLADVYFATLRRLATDEPAA